MFPAQYICPICKKSLTLKSKSYRCENNHSFDEAKEGYVNLLPVQYKHSKDPGDNKAMVSIANFRWYVLRTRMINEEYSRAPIYPVVHQ